MVVSILSVAVVILVVWLTTKTSGRTIRFAAAAKPVQGVKVVRQRWLPALPKVSMSLPNRKITFPLRKPAPRRGITIVKGGWKW